MDTTHTSTECTVSIMDGYIRTYTHTHSVVRQREKKLVATDTYTHVCGLIPLLTDEGWISFHLV